MRRLIVLLVIAAALLLGAFSIDGLAPSDAQAYFSDPGGGGGGWLCEWVSGILRCFWK